MPPPHSLSKKQALPLRPRDWHDRSHPSPPKGSRRLLVAAVVLGSLFIGLFVFFFFQIDIVPLSEETHSECSCVHPRGDDKDRLPLSKNRGEEYPHKDGGEAALGGPELLGNATLPRPKLLGLVGLQTGFHAAERRKALRETWLPQDPEGMSRLEQATALAFRFVIGKTSDSKKMFELEREIERYKDFLCIDLEEENINQAKKTLAFFKAAHMLFDADFYVKAGDNIYLRPDRLATLLAKDRPSSRTYLGCMKKGPVVKNPKMKWYEPLGYMLGNEYFYHACGPIYAVSLEVVASLASSRNNSFRFFSNEDVTVGAWMLAMNVDHEDNQHLCDSKCTDRSIAVWDFPKCSGLCMTTKQLRDLHNMDKCSNSPTLPAEEE